MITVLRAAGLRVTIYRHDHEPPHVHVLGQGEVKVLLVGADDLPAVIEVRGMKFGDLQKAMRAITENQDLLLAEWERIHG